MEDLKTWNGPECDRAHRRTSGKSATGWGGLSGNSTGKVQRCCTTFADHTRLSSLLERFSGSSFRSQEPFDIRRLAAKVPQVMRES